MQQTYYSHTEKQRYDTAMYCNKHKVKYEVQLAK